MARKKRLLLKNKFGQTMTKRTRKILVVVAATGALVILLAMGGGWWYWRHPEYGGNFQCRMNLYTISPIMYDFSSAHDGNGPESLKEFREYCISRGISDIAQYFLCPNDDTGGPSYELLPLSGISNCESRSVLMRELVPRHGGQRTVMYSDGSLGREN